MTKKYFKRQANPDGKKGHNERNKMRREDNKKYKYPLWSRCEGHKWALLDLLDDETEQKTSDH